MKWVVFVRLSAVIVIMKIFKRMRRLKSLISADNSAKLIRLGVGQKVKPRARTNNLSLESGVWDKLITEVVSRLVVLWVLRGLRLRRLRVLPACVGAVGEGVGVLSLGHDVWLVR